MNVVNEAHQAVELAASLLRRAVQLQTPQERRQQAELDRMINLDDDKATLVEMTDQAFRTRTPARVADQLTHLLDVQGIPRFFSPLEQAMLRGFQSFGEYLPGVAVPLVKEKMRRETANVILPAEPEHLAEHLRNRQSQGVRMNVNLLGEAILGEDEARRRFDQCVEALRMPDVKCLSVKISTLNSQISPLARRHTVTRTADRLESLYRIAGNEVDPSTGAGKFVYLDMEEYRDLHLTADILREALDRSGLQKSLAGVALQAYLPDSFHVMRELIDWSVRRVRHGGSPLTIRLVKGANLEMERVEASIGGHPQAPFQTKIETDANYKRMLRALIQGAADPAADSPIRIGLASHNLFDVALGIIWADKLGVGDAVQIEMLEGMANHQRRALSERDRDLLLYAPACRRDGFLNAIGYLIRRLDENTGPQNFLRHSYRLEPDGDEFKTLADDFLKAVSSMDRVSDQPRRKQNRSSEPARPHAAQHWSVYVNEPDTDWSLPDNSDWAEDLLGRWKANCDDKASDVRLNIGDESVATDPAEQRETLDPSRPGVVVSRYQAASLDRVRRAVSIAADAVASWCAETVARRHEVLRDVAQELRRSRGDLIGAMVAEGGKTVTEADPEVSEAIDFCEFYPLTMIEMESWPEIGTAPRGVVAVITPWNFPLAIPCGGIAAALSAGNSVLLKPAAQTVLTASLLCQAFWDAGVPKTVLQMIPCDDAVAEEGLVKNDQVDAVILTGGTSTGKRMLSVRPGLHLLAETGGKNATVVTAMADRDLAIKHVVHSAFSHSGQKCSATSLLLLEDEVFDDPLFRSTLADAVESLAVGSAWDLHTRVGPLIDPPGEDLSRGLKALEDDESWLVVPEHVVGNPNLYRPGVKWNIKPGSFSHLTELFGPVLGVMRFTRLEQAIEIVRSTGYGLTSGLESLDDREIELWKQTIHAGNLYVNRPTTGAIVLRQPFGGVGLSAYGPGVKAGGPHYLQSLLKIENAVITDTKSGSTCDSGFAAWLDTAIRAGRIDDAVAGAVRRATVSQLAAMADEYGHAHDTVRLVGQDNFRRYRPVRGLTIRFNDSDELVDILVSVGAAVAAGSQLTLSIDPVSGETNRATLESVADSIPGMIHTLEETEAELAGRIAEQDVARLRLLAPLDQTSSVYAACASSFVTVIQERVVQDGRIECLRYLDEQSISEDYHRYGNLGRRVDEDRREVH